MSLQPMPIAAQVLGPGSSIRFARGTGGILGADQIREAAKSGVRFEIQVASELYWRGKQNDYDLSNDFGSLRLPYDDCWMEWSWPALIVVDGEEIPAPFETRLAAFCHSSHIGGGRCGLVTQLLMQQVHAEPVVVCPAVDYIEVNKTGSFIDGSRRTIYSNPAVRPTQDEADDDQEIIARELNAFYLALNLINCKNVATEHAGVVHVRRSGSAKRRREPKLDYRTIVLPGMSVGSSGHVSSQDVMPLHRVRGHFKTFTADAPLLGMHTGTYWWGWQVRGNKKNGVVVSDYKVGAPAGGAA